ncbi:hypothetical protein GUJ93_ZPchr0337g7083 [Zizania palustris]|uniref:Uncharacterized protein n=1 Tax=Zizania palustris TaxID=103762 RepID=A0A8J5VBK0_ZIZPA|nr:hypothetical protein GUJ93_ZPchr0337g7083 [Zizania palustris]
MLLIPGARGGGSCAGALGGAVHEVTPSLKPWATVAPTRAGRGSKGGRFDLPRYGFACFVRESGGSGVASSRSGDEGRQLLTSSETSISSKREMEASLAKSGREREGVRGLRRATLDGADKGAGDGVGETPGGTPPSRQPPFSQAIERNDQ